MRRLLLLALLLAGALCAAPRIHIWYGKSQRFGRPGLPQKWVNILGSVTEPEQVAGLSYSLNSGPEVRLSIGADLYRLARPGDFNADLDHALLKPGGNRLRIRLRDRAGRSQIETVAIHYIAGREWPLPYSVDWSKLKRIGEGAQIVDGAWRLEPGGVRTAAPWYDRVLAIGSMSWRDYEVTVDVTLHGFTGPEKCGPYYGVTHFGIGLRWQGHHEDGKQPRVQWYPLGSANEFMLFPDPSRMRWRILYGGPRGQRRAPRTRPLAAGRRYRVKSRVETLPNGYTLYRNKIWDAAEAEPLEWDVEGAEDQNDLQSGSLVLVAHNSDVTFGNLTVTPVGER